MILSQSSLRIKPSAMRQCAERRRWLRFRLAIRRLTSFQTGVDWLRYNITLRREVVDKILIDIPAVLSLTIPGPLVLGVFLLATLLDGMGTTLLFAIYIVFWSLQYTTAFRSYLNDRQDERINS